MNVTLGVSGIFANYGIPLARQGELDHGFKRVSAITMFRFGRVVVAAFPFAEEESVTYRPSPEDNSARTALLARPLSPRALHRLPTCSGTRAEATALMNRRARNCPVL